MIAHKFGLPINKGKSNEIKELTKKIEDAFKATNLQLELILSNKDEDDEIKRKINNLKRIINNNYDQLKVKLEQPPNGLLTILDHITNELEIISNKTQTPVNRNNLISLQPILNELVNLKNENKDILNDLENKTTQVSNEIKELSNETSQILNKSIQLSNETNSAFQAAALRADQILNKTTQVSNEVNSTNNKIEQISNTIENAQRVFNLQLETTFNEIKSSLDSALQAVNLRLDSTLQTVNQRLNNLEEKSKGLQYISNILVLENSNRDISSAFIECDFGDFVKCEIALVEFRTTGNVGRGTIHVSIRSLRDGYYKNKLKKSIYSFQHNGGRIRQKPPALIYYSITKVIPRTSNLHVSFTYEDGNSVNLRNCYLKFHVRKYMRINDENAYYEEGIRQFGMDIP